MPHTISYNPAMQIIEVKVQGTIILDELKDIYSQAVQLGQEKKCFLFLSDFREASFKMSTLELYTLPEILSGVSEAVGIKANRLRRAIVIAPKDLQDANFAEAVTANQGQHARFFLDREQAQNWLLGKSTKSRDV